MRCSIGGWLWPAAIAVTTAACSHPYERSSSPGLPDVAFRAHDAASGDDGSRDPALPDVDGTLNAYVARALAGHPALRARYYEWRAAASEVAVARKLPEPRLSYGLFARSVETRVGPQNHRLSLSQTLPWPTVFSRASDAAAHKARAAERLFEAEALAVRLRIARSYWDLWRTRRQREIHRAHRDLLLELGSAIRARVEVDRASLADASQVDLAVSRMDDKVQALASFERERAAALAAAVGLPGGTIGELQTDTEPGEPATPRTARAQLVAEALDHPAVRRFEYLASASESARRRETARGLPALTVGVDYIQTGAAAVPSTPGSGRDAVILSAGLSIPLWRGSYAAAEQRERSRQKTALARAAATRIDVRARIDTALARVTETARQIEFIKSTLAPQAESVYAAQVGAYATGDSTLASVLLAQEQVLELRLALAEQRAAHQGAWSELEVAVGRAVERMAARRRPAAAPPEKGRR